MSHLPKWHRSTIGVASVNLKNMIAIAKFRGGIVKFRNYSWGVGFLSKWDEGVEA
jgi:hypothetical protein